MATAQSLRGSCACGRNRYVVEIPQQTTASDVQDAAQVLFDNSSANRRHQAAPFTAWLRIPLSWYRSSTYAFFPDESHASIRRTFTSPFHSDTQRQFCGYCGTQLTSWTERTREDADFISLTLGSILDEDVNNLETLGLLPSSDGNDNEEEEDEGYAGEEQPSTTVISRPLGGLFRPVGAVQRRGAPWFEEMIEHSRLGRIKRQRGGHTSADGSTKVEWEVVEVNNVGQEIPGAETVVIGKRKFADSEEDVGDTTMRG